MGKKVIQGTLEVTDGIKLTAASDVTIGGDQFGNELIYATRNSMVLASPDNVLIQVENEQLQLQNLVDPQNELDAATKKYVDESQVKVKRFI